MSQIRFPLRNAMFSGIRLVANQLLPLLALPFMLGTLGSVKFGTLIFTQAIAWYFVVLVEYGFNLTAVRAVAVEKSDPEKIRTIFYDVLATKLFLFGVSVTIAGLISFVFLDDSKALSLMIAMVLALGAALQPVWLFQGLEEFGLISVVQVASRLICFGGIFILIRQPSDAYGAQLLMALPYCLNAAFLVPVAVKRFGLPPRRHATKWASTSVEVLKDGSDVFVGQLATTLFSSTTTVLSGAALGASFAGYYGIAEKMIRGIAMLTTPITEALYPRLAAAFSSGISAERSRAFALVSAVLICVGSVLAAVGAGIAIAGESLARVVSTHGAGVQEIRLAFGWLAFIPLMIFVNNVFGVQILLGMGFTRMYRNVVLLAGVLIPILGFTLPHFWGFAGYPIALFVGELVLASTTFLLAKRYTDWGLTYAARN